MEIGLIGVVVAALASWLLGAAWYMALAKPWIAASGVKVGADGRPEGGSPLPFILSAICMLLVAGMMRHLLVSAGIDTVGKSLLTGLGIGAFFIAPWVMINNAYGMRPFLLTVIDGGYAIAGCGVIGLVLALF